MPRSDSIHAAKVLYRILTPTERLGNLKTWGLICGPLRWLTISLIELFNVILGFRRQNTCSILCQFVIVWRTF